MSSASSLGGPLRTLTLASAKLKARSHQLGQFREMILEGVIGIVEGMNPTLIRLKLDAYNDAPPPKPVKKPDAASQKAPGAAQPAKAAAAGS